MLYMDGVLSSKILSTSP